MVSTIFFGWPQNEGCITTNRVPFYSFQISRLYSAMVLSEEK